VKPEEAKSERIGMGKPESAYGLYISIQEQEADRILAVHKAGAKKEIEVAVKYQDDVKEFHLQEFLALLGFDSEGQGEMSQ